MDANLSEFSITEQRKGAVDFSSPYFDVTQAVVTVKSSRAAGDVEQLGIVLDKGSPLTRYLSWAVDTFRGDGTLAKLEQQSLTDAGKAPVLT